MLKKTEKNVNKMDSKLQKFSKKKEESIEPNEHFRTEISNI